MTYLYMEDITEKYFPEAIEKGLRVFYDDNLDQFTVMTEDLEMGLGCFDDELNEEGDASSGEAQRKIREVIANYPDFITGGKEKEYKVEKTEEITREIDEARMKEITREIEEMMKM